MGKSFPQSNFGQINVGKGQIISECPYEIIVSPKVPTKKFPNKKLY